MSEALDRVKVVFELLDADGTGRLEAADFELMADRVVEAAPDSTMTDRNAMVAAFEKYWVTLAAELDTDGDNTVSFEEYQACVLSPERFDETVADFAQALATLGDPDGDGLIERPVFVALMTAIGFELPNIHALFDAFGPADDDRIGVETWIVGIKDFYAPDKAGIPGDYLVPSATA
jgi:Ca2+-binding EF-hand superfamily protein